MASAATGSGGKPPAVNKKIVVDLDRQVLDAFEGDTVKYHYDCVSGDSQHPTPVALFHILRKYKEYMSKTYKVRMDYAMFFTTTGEAIHMSHAVGVTSELRALMNKVNLSEYDPFGSHGCVRLSEENARELFDWAPIGTVVEVRKSRPAASR